MDFQSLISVCFPELLSQERAKPLTSPSATDSANQICKQKRCFATIKQRYQLFGKWLVAIEWLLLV